MKYIPVGNGKEAIVDDDFPESLFTMKWRTRARNYVCIEMRFKNEINVVFLHYAVLDRKDGFFIDHINGNPLDNQRANLRYATHAQNMRNRKLNKNNTSGYKGVLAPRGKDKTWRAEIKCNNIRYRLGSFKNKEDAARAYNIAAIRYHGEFARLNIIS